MGAIDYIVMAAYFGIMLLIGILASKKVKTSSDFTSAGKSLPLIVVIGSSMATCMSASMIFGNYSGVHKYGLSGYMGTIMYFVGWGGLIFFIKYIRQSGATSIVEYVGINYGKKAEIFASFALLVMLAGITANQFIACGTICETLGLCSFEMGTIAGAIFILLFTVFSGLWGVTLTDTFQIVVIVAVLVFIMPFMTFDKAGGIEYVLANTDPSRLNPLEGMSFTSLISLILARMLSTSVDSPYAQRALAAKEDKNAVKGTAISVITCFIMYIVVIMPVFTIPFLFPDMTDGSQLVPTFILTYFPPVAKGVSFAAILGLLVTTGDTFLLMFGSTYCDNLLPYFKPNISDEARMKHCKLCICLVPLILLPLALYWKDIYTLTNATMSVNGAAMFFPILFAILRKGKMNKQFATIAVGAGGLITLIWDFAFKESGGGILVGGAISLIFCIIASIVPEKKTVAGDAE